MRERTKAERDHARQVREMFAGIAGRYDLLNHLLSLNYDRRWRRLVADDLASALAPGAKVLDVACGTGDLVLEIAKRFQQPMAIGVDFCRPMLERARAKAADRASSIKLVEADALKLPFRDQSFDAVSIAFGLRNLADFEAGLQELFRVTKPGGQVLILEFSRPAVPGFRALFNSYFHNLLPFIGGVVSGSRRAYQYLPRSVASFPDQERLSQMMSDSGFRDVAYRNLTGGVAALHRGLR